MRAFIVGNHDRASLEAPLRTAGIGIADSVEGADFLVTHGGDGSLIGAERLAPGLPKLPVRPDAAYRKCARHALPALLARVAAGDVRETLLPKLRGRANGREVLAINDIHIHSRRVVSALRCRVRIDGRDMGSVIVGDGIVVSTPFGSTAYYRAITRCVFRTGIGVAFNNTTDPLDHLVLPREARIEVEVVRGPAAISGDNQHEVAHLDAGDTAEVAIANECARVWELDSLLCTDCIEVATGRPAGHLHRGWE
jgi:NAD+ kinase